jgi:ABC-2 type transport system ATP-binding protein
MDEPVANLDPKARNEFFNILKGLLKRDKAIFISSHVLAELDLYANSVTILDGGKIIYDGDKKTLMTKFFKHQYEISTDNNEFTKAFLKKEKIKYSWRPEDKTIVAVFSDSTKVTIFQKNLIKHNITFTKFTKVEPTLDEVYNKLVIKGSVDTQKG